MSGEIAAVDAGDIVGQQGQKRLGVIPIEEMAAMALQGLHGVHGIGCAFEEPSGGNEAEVVGSQIGEQGQAHVGRGRAMGDDFHRMFLHVIGGQPVILGTDEGVEEGPGLAGHAA